MGRLLILLGLVLLSFYLIKRIFLSPPSTNTESPAEKGLMKKCLNCELHVPAEEGISDAKGNFFCSEAHRDTYTDTNE